MPEDNPDDYPDDNPDNSLVDNLQITTLNATPDDTKVTTQITV
jgi:hypothetical protein